SLPIETERLSLRLFRDQDFDAYQSYHALPEVYRYLYASPPTIEDARATFKSVCIPAFAKDGDEIRLAVTRRTDNALLGEVLLKLANQAALQ
ncbi:GNAT family N-acetyltransferase, partial [Klebsiella pneumoniae]|uniref:GNAT family N-acetyltransferase n=1 Tax=Klebsiella pneumoniae TaxID=573 RepID=UPI00402B179C